MDNFIVGHFLLTLDITYWPCASEVWPGPGSGQLIWYWWVFLRNIDESEEFPCRLTPDNWSRLSECHERQFLWSPDVGSWLVTDALFWLLIGPSLPDKSWSDILRSRPLETLTHVHALNIRVYKEVMANKELKMQWSTGSVLRHCALYNITVTDTSIS